MFTNVALQQKPPGYRHVFVLKKVGFKQARATLLTAACAQAPANIYASVNTASQPFNICLEHHQGRIKKEYVSQRATETRHLAH